MTEIYEVWYEENCERSYWSTEEKALDEISRLSKMPRNKLSFKKHFAADRWLLNEDGGYTDPGIVISKIELDSGKYI